MAVRSNTNLLGYRAWTKTPTLDLAFSRWSSPAVVATLAGVLGVLTGAAVLTWPVVDAFGSRQLDSKSRAMLVAIGLVVAACSGRGFVTSERSCARDGWSTRRGWLDSSANATYRWAQIAGFDVIGPDDFMASHPPERSCDCAAGSGLSSYGSIISVVTAATPRAPSPRSPSASRR